MRRSNVLLIAVAAVQLFSSARCMALILGGTGNDPLPDPGWPAGAATVFNNESRVAYWEGPPLGGGEFHAECRGDAATLSELLKDFAKIESPQKRIILLDGEGGSFWLKAMTKDENPPDTRIDWEFVVWQKDRLEQFQKMPARFRRDLDEADAVPTLVVYTGRLSWKEVVPPGEGETWPDDVLIDDQRLAAHGFALEDGTVEEGVVRDAAGDTLLGATVELRQRDPDTGEYATAKTVETDAEGHWLMTQLAAGSYQLIASADGKLPRVFAQLAVTDQPRWQSWEASLTEPASISGRVVDGDGQPLADVKVHLDGVTDSTGNRYSTTSAYAWTTDADGKFSSDNVPDGQGTFIIFKAGYCHLGVGETVELPASDVQLSMVKAATLKVTVNFPQAPPKGGYLVHIEPEGGEAVGKYGGSGNIGPDHSMEFQRIPPGRYVITGRPNPGSDDEETESVAVELAGGEVRELELTAK